MATLDIIVAEAPPLTMLPNGAIRVRGTRVSLDSVIYAFDEGLTPEQIVHDFSTLQLPDVYVVIAFYLRHREDVHAYIEERRQNAAELRRKIEESCPPDGFRERLMARWEAKQKQKQ